MFCSEFLKNSHIQTNKQVCIEFIKAVQPTILFKTVYDKSFINREAKSAINSSLETCLFVENLDVFLKDGTMSKLGNKALIENSYTFITAFIGKIDTEFFNFKTASDEQRRVI